MSTLTYCADTIGLKFISNWFKRLGEKIEHNRRVYATIHELSKLTDRELNDIGLTRGDIWSVAHGDEDFKRNYDADHNPNLKGWV